MSVPAPRVLMIRPAAFGPNPETAASNAFQRRPPPGDLLALARAEFDAAVTALRAAGVDVVVADDTPQPVKPDAVFPNNWFSSHPYGTVVLYPMEAQNRRLERRRELLEDLARRGQLRMQRVIDLSPLEARGEYLEGTGSLIIDRAAGRAYAALSSRTHSAALAEFTRATGLQVSAFRTADDAGRSLYHTNVMLSLGDRFAVVCLDAVPDAAESSCLAADLATGGRDVIGISRAQMQAFCGNVLQVGRPGARPAIALSATAHAAFSASQRDRLATHGDLVRVTIPLIEQVGGGSIRCMLGELY